MSDLILPLGVQVNEPEKKHLPRIKYADGTEVPTTEEREEAAAIQEILSPNPEPEEVGPEVQSVIALFADEKRKVNALKESINRQFVGVPATGENLYRQMDILENEMAALGFHADVYAEAYTNGQGATYMVVNLEVIGRVKKQEFDHDQMAHEVQHGQHDGVEGKMVNDKLVDPPKSF